MRNLNNNGEPDGEDAKTPRTTRNWNTGFLASLSIQELLLRGIITHSFAIADEKTGELIGDDDDLGTWRRYDDTFVEPYDPSCLEDDCFGGSFVQNGRQRGGANAHIRKTKFCLHSVLEEEKEE